MALVNPIYALTFGSLNLLGSPSDPAGWWIQAAGDGADFGNPEGVAKEILSLLLDGAEESYESYVNREVTLKLSLWSTTSAGLAAAEAALMAEVAKKNVLVWTPPTAAGDGLPAVFDVVNSFPNFQFGDLNELYFTRVWNLTIKALPWVRSQAPTTVTNAAPPGTAPTVATINAANSHTPGWLISSPAPSNGTQLLSSDGASVRGKWTNSTSGVAQPSAYVMLRLSFTAINMSSTPYVRIEMGTGAWQNTTPITTQVTLYDNLGTAYVVSPANQTGTVAWYKMPTGVTMLSTIDMRATTSLAAGASASLTLRVDDVSRSSLAQDASGARQRGFNLPVVGSARTQGSLVVADPTVALGTVLVYTATADGAISQPNLRVRRTAGSAETTDSSTVSGKYSDLSTNHVFQIPSVNLDPGAYVLYARVKHATGAKYDLNWAAKSVMGTTTVGSNWSGIQPVTLTSGVYATVPVANFPLPMTSTGANGITQIELSGPSGVLLDDAWIFNLTTGRLVHVETGTATPASGGPANRVFIDAPSLLSPAPSVKIGTDSEQADAFSPGYPAIQSQDEPIIVPPSMSVFVVTSNSIAAAVTLNYYPRWHTHVAA